MKKTRIILLAIISICIIFTACETASETDNDAANESNSFLEYKRVAEDSGDLPIGIEVRLNNTPNGGVFSVAFFTDDDGVLVPREEAAHVEIHECDKNGNSIHRTYMKLG